MNEQGGGQDSRTILIFTGIFLVLFLGLQYFKKKEPVPPAVQQHAATTSAPSSQQAAVPDVPASTSKQTPAANAITAENESTTVVENELYRVTFSNRGAQVKSWILKKYKDDDGNPLDLVNQAADCHRHP